MGRKSLITDELTDKITRLLSQGVTDKDACAHVGISTQSFYVWLNIGEACIDGTKLDPKLNYKKPLKLDDQKKYIVFHDAVTRARGVAMVGATLALRQGMMPHDVKTQSVDTFQETRIGGDGKPYTYTQTRTKETVARHPADWRAAVAYLSRRDRQNWSDRLEVTGADGSELFQPIAIVKMDLGEI